MTFRLWIRCELLMRRFENGEKMNRRRHEQDVPELKGTDRTVPCCWSGTVNVTCFCISPYRSFAIFEMFPDSTRRRETAIAGNCLSRWRLLVNDTFVRRELGLSERASWWRHVTSRPKSAGNPLVIKKKTNKKNPPANSSSGDGEILERLDN